jgi:hypothetical protein
MGLTNTIRFEGETPAWSAIRDGLAAAGLTCPIRMIDGLPAFPDEEPPDDWRELRLGTPAGMVTLRREPRAISVITWGNADAEGQRCWNRVTQAVAAAGRGIVET